MYRLPICDVPFQDISCDGEIVQIFDQKTKTWMTREDYESLLVEDGILEGLNVDCPKNKEEAILNEVHLHMKNDLKRKLPEGDEFNTAAAATDAERKEKQEKKRKYRERKKLKKMAGVWVNVEKNSIAYVSGLPTTITVEKLHDLFSKKAGVIQKNPVSNEPKIKLYRKFDDDDEAPLKGDCTIFFAKAESVDLAIKFLDDYEIEPNCRISVQKANLKKEVDFKTDEELKILAEKNLEAKKIKAAERHAMKMEAERKLTWNENSIIGKGKAQRIMLLRNSNFHSNAETPENLIKLICKKFTDVKIEHVHKIDDFLFSVKFQKTEGLELIEKIDGKNLRSLLPEIKLEDAKIEACAYGNENFEILKRKNQFDRQKKDQNWENWLEEVSSESEFEIQCE